ncbi:MAG: radical SAM protein [Muricomes sp.]
MDILMIQTGVEEKERKMMGVGNRYRMNMPMLGLLYLKELTPQDINVEYVDEINGLITEYKKYDIVAISGMTMHANRMYKLADEYRKLGCHVAAGGIHVSFMPEESLKHVDTVMIGEGENTWIQFIEDFKQGKAKRIYQSSCFTDLSQLPIIDRKIVDSQMYKPPYGTPNSIIATRGCPNRCDFCCVRKMYTGYRVRPIEHVIREVQGLDDNVIVFQDDNLIGDLNYSRQLIDELGNMHKRWGGQASINIANQASTLELLEKSGCVSLFIGFESINPESLKSVHKAGVNRIDKYSENIKKIQDRGIKIIGSFIVGMDYDTEASINELYEFIVNSKIDLPIVNCLTPFPGTELFFKLENEGRIVDYNWERYNLTQVVIQPKTMTMEKLQFQYDTLVHYLNKQVVKYGF